MDNLDKAIQEKSAQVINAIFENQKTVLKSRQTKPKQTKTQIIKNKIIGIENKIKNSDSLFEYINLDLSDDELDHPDDLYDEIDSINLVEKISEIKLSIKNQFNKNDLIDKIGDLPHKSKIELQNLINSINLSPLELLLDKRQGYSLLILIIPIVRHSALGGSKKDKLTDPAVFSCVYFYRRRGGVGQLQYDFCICSIFDCSYVYDYTATRVSRFTNADAHNICRDFEMLESDSQTETMRRHYDLRSRDLLITKSIAIERVDYPIRGKKQLHRWLHSHLIARRAHAVG